MVEISFSDNKRPKRIRVLTYLIVKLEAILPVKS